MEANRPAILALLALAEEVRDGGLPGTASIIRGVAKDLLDATDSDVIAKVTVDDLRYMASQDRKRQEDEPLRPIFGIRATQYERTAEIVATLLPADPIAAIVAAEVPRETRSLAQRALAARAAGTEIEIREVA